MSIKVKGYLLWLFLSVLWMDFGIKEGDGHLDKSWLATIDISKPTKDGGGRIIRSNSGNVGGMKEFLLNRIGSRGSKVQRFKGDNGIRVTTPKPSIVTTEEDKKARKDWGGNCTHKDWVKCSRESFFGKDVFDLETGKKVGEQLNCANDTLFPPVCLFNGWTVTRCHLMCLAMDCNGDLKINYDKYVSKDGFC